ncbi:hypothetical protein BVRB_4g088080 [Beta vulgaris subsp. vulgaris]|nr:hypothetical protein BVRB_4g088080 [Beta vulgaris subsp. vulgaris]
MEELKSNAEELWRIQREVEEEVKKAKEAGNELDEEAIKWLDKVKKISGNMKDKIDGKVEKNRVVHKMKQLFSSNNQSKNNSSHDVLEIKTLVDEGKSVLTTCFPGDPIGIEHVWRAGFVNFSSRRSEYNRTMEGLKDEKVGLIGICGMGGMGKTKLVEEIGMNVKQRGKLFDHVVIATVSQEVDIRNIQGIFADMLNLTFTENTESGRAYELQEKLEKESKILVILDDVWEKINIESIGVPVYSNHKGCKIILTTRSEKVCDDMGCSLIVRLGKIDNNEAMGLFNKSAELIYKKPKGLIKITEKIVEECAGLPLAIVTVGRALRGRSLDEFEDAALKLSNSSYVDIEDVDKDVYACLKLSYDYLRDKDVQNCLLLCSSYPEDSKIMVEELVRYSYGLWLFDKVESVDEARQMIINSVEILEKASLLYQQKPPDPDPFLEKHCVKMHDVVRDVALWIAEKEYGPFIVVYSFKELKKKMSENQFAVSLTSYYEEVPGEVRFPATLKFLRMRIRKCPGCLDKLVFAKPSTLQVLDIDISYEPWDDEEEVPDVPLELFVNLRTLRFPGERYWRESEMSIKFSKLKNLEILQLGKVLVLPKWIWELCKLRMLDVYHGCQIPSKLLSRINMLEELYFQRFKPEVESNNVSDLFLPDLNMRIVNLGMGDFKVEMPKRYWITACEYPKIYSDIHPTYPKLGWSKVLEVKSLRNDVLSMKVFKPFLKAVEYLCTDGKMEGIFNLCPQLEDTGFQNIRILQILGSENIECLIDTRGTERGLPSLTTVNVFPILEKLSLKGMPQLEKMCYGQPPLSCLGQLRCLTLDICPRLKNIVPDMLPGSGELLEELKIMNCNAMNYVYDVDAEATPYRLSLLPSPTTMHLWNLEDIRSIWKVPPYKLKWKDPVDEEGEVGSSTKFVKAILRSFESLVTLNIENCAEMEEVFPLLDFDNRKCDGRLSKLVELHLKELPKLKSIWTNHHWLLHRLESIYLYKCDNLTTLFTSAVAKSLVKLQKLQILNCKALQTIIVPDDDCCEASDGIMQDIFKEIKIIEIEYCDNLKSVLPISFITYCLPKLERIHIQDCANLEQVFVDEEGIVTETEIIEWKNLQYLKLWNLPRLVSLVPFNWHLKISSLSELTINPMKQDRPWMMDIETCSFHLKEALLDVKEAQQQVFTQLKKMQVGDMPHLKHLWKGHTQFLNLCNLAEIYVHNCASIKTLFPLSVAQNLQNLISLKVVNCSSLEHIFDDDIRSEGRQSTNFDDDDTRHLLKRMVLKEVGCFSSIFPPDHVLSCQSFVVEPNKVTIENCKTDVDCASTWGSVILPNITTLYQLVKLSELRHITVKNMVITASLFPHHVAQALGSLEILEVDNCNELENLIEPAGDIQLPCFPNLQGLILNKLSNLAYIWKGTTKLINLSRLEYIRLYECDRLTSLFTSTLAKCLVKLEELQIKSCKALETIIARDDKSCEASTGTQDSFNEVKIIRVEFCDNLKSVLPISFVANGLQKLRSFTIAYCDNLEQVFVDEEGIVAKAAIIEWKNLDSLVLWELPKLVRLVPFNWHLKIISSLSKFEISLEYQEGPWMMDIETCSFHMEEALLDVKEAQQQVFTQLQDMRVVDMPHLKHLWKGHTHFLNLCNLAQIYVYSCASIKNLFALSVAQNLPNLRRLEVVNCSSLEYIFDDDIRSEGRQSTNLEGVNNVNNLPLLEIMILKEVCCFSSICPLDYILDCASFVQPTQVTIENCKTDVDYSDDLGRYLRFILPNITTLCQLVNLSQLRHITVKNSVALSNSRSLFPHHVAQALGCLEILEVDNCNEVENLIEPAGDVQLPYFPNLQGLILNHLSNLAYIWKGTRELINLSRLEYIRLYECDRLTSLFTSTLAKSLVKLEELQIKSCKALETIIIQDDESCEASTGTQDSFKEIKIIEVEYCDNLKSVLPISFVAHGLPKLESFYIGDCDNLEQVFVDEEGIVAKTSIIEWKNLDYLVLWNLPKLVRLVPFNWHLKIISSLSVFAVSLKYQEGPWMMDIETCSFHMEEALLDVKEAQQQVFTQLQDMRVVDMPHLKHLWKGHTHFLNLCNLAQIYVYSCASIKNLFPLSVAQNLPNLRRLEVVNCSSLEYIFDDDIRSEGRQSTNLEVVNNVNNLPLLEIMILKEVCCFSSICPLDYVLDCASFVQPTQVTIENCKTYVDYSDDLRRYLRCILPNITTLCQLVNLSQLRHITVKDSVALSKSLFPRNITQALGSLETLKVANCNELENLIEPARDQDSTQLHENNSATCFPCLMYLSVYKCEKLKTVFPLSVAQSLPKLSGITLSRARELEEIFTDDLNEEYVSGCNKLIKLPELTILRLRQLPRLSRMCPAGYALCCPNPPKDLIIDECSLTMDADKWFPPIYSENIRQCAIEWNTSQRMN